MAVATHPPIQTSSTPVQTIRSLLKADLIAAMKARQTDTITTIRMLLAAIDNAEAVPLTAAPVSIDGHTPDVPRTILHSTDIAGILMREADECRQAIADYTQLGQHDAAAPMHTALALIESYQLAIASEVAMAAPGGEEQPQ